MSKTNKFSSVVAFLVGFAVGLALSYPKHEPVEDPFDVWGTDD